MRDPETWQAEKAAGAYDEECEICGNDESECICDDPFYASTFEGSDGLY